MRLLKAEELFRKVLDGGLKKPRLLGLDVGSKYVGLAVSDHQNKVALPLSVLGRTKENIDAMADDFKILVKNYSLEGLVVGYPFNLQGQPSPDCVEALLNPLKLNDRSETKTMNDKFAAVCILQGYLDNMNRARRSAENRGE